MNSGVAAFFAPITLMVGGALVALGLLSLLDLNYFKTPLRAKAALALGLVFLIATEMLFVTSNASGRYFEGQKLDVTECEFKIERDYAHERRSNPRLVQEKIVACMDALGYDWSIDRPQCAEARMATNPFCYLPRDVMQRSVVAFQMEFE